ncbi:MAG: hypothetical protein ULS35scaffold63_38 [Phage 33_17]|nr:MAG: hypothetical protein ULS35scaffold63_38 [Phage 33_17]
MSNTTRQYLATTILEGQTVSNAIDCQNTTLVALSISSSFSGTSITFQGSIDLNGTYFSVVDGNNNVITYDVSQSRYVLIAAADFMGAEFLKIISNNSQSGGDCTITAVTIPLQV